MRRIAEKAYEASTELVLERGTFPMFDLEAHYADAKPFDVKFRSGLWGRRNSHLLTVAPTGTTALLAGNVTSGIEPSFAWQYERKMLMANGELQAFKVEDYGYTQYRNLYPTGKLPDYMVTASDVSVSEHIQMQAAAQAWVDSAVSKTVNCPESISFDEFKHVYELAYSLGCKGCTTYRPSKVRGAVLCSLDGDCSNG
jgi:ribonucleoside-diphosphate reductase alpha chain